MSLQVRIFKKATPPTQSGPMLKKQWVLEYETTSPRRPESLMGWTSSQDTLNQVRMAFASQEEAIAYAKKNEWRYVLSLTSEKRIVPRNYSDNFQYTGPAVKKSASKSSSAKKVDKKAGEKKVAVKKGEAKKTSPEKLKEKPKAKPKAKTASKAKGAAKKTVKPKAKTTKKTDTK